MIGVAVVVVREERLGSLEAPPQWLTPKAILVLLATGYCNFEKLSRSPLLKTPSVAFLCPLQGNTTYRVVTRLASDEWHTLGLWDPDSFSTWDDLFQDRFVDFEGKVLRLMCSYDDVPLVHESEDGSVDGSNIRIINAMSHWLNFTPVYEVPTDGNSLSLLSNPSALHAFFFC